MARKIRFPLKMQNGAEVRTLEELKDNFDLESVLGYFTDGKLSTWLSDRYYDEKANAVSALSADMADLNARLCEILEVEYQAQSDETDLEIIQKRRKKICVLSNVISDRTILDNVDIVALDQDDLYDILDESPEKIYLYGEKFEIPFGVKNIFYIGLNSPTVVFENSKSFLDYDMADITFKDVNFGNASISLVTKGEKLFLDGKYKEAFPLIKKSAENGIARAMYILSLYFEDGYDTIKISNDEKKFWLEKASHQREPLSFFEYSKYNNVPKNIRAEIIDKIYELANTGDILAKYALVYITDEYGIEVDCRKCVELCLYLAESGLALAQYTLGKKYEYGFKEEDDNGDYKYYLNENKDDAVRWLTSAANQGLMSAQDELGSLYYNGYCVEQNYSKAFKWYKLAATQGNEYSQYYLGNMYFDGNGVSADYEKAVELFIESAENGYSESKFKLGQIYENGTGVYRSYDKACKYFSMYASNSPSSMQRIAKMYETGDNVTKNYEKALEWYYKATELKCEDEEIVDSYIAIGRIYDSYYKNYVKACEWYQKAFTIDKNKASTIGSMYSEGDEITQDYSKALEWFIKGAENEDADSQIGLGDLYAKGNGVSEDHSIAKKWYNKALELKKKYVLEREKEVEMIKNRIENGEDASELKLSFAEMSLSFAEMAVSTTEYKLTSLDMKGFDWSIFG